MLANKHIVWITWERHQRNRSIATRIGAELVELEFSGLRWLRYPVLAFKTLKQLLVHRNAQLIVQNPSIVLATLAVLVRRLSGRPIVVDAHNAGLMPLEGRSRAALAVAGWLLSKATLTIVTNEGLAGYVTARGGRPFVLPDPVPDIAARKLGRELPGGFRILFICTWADDEPFVEVLRAAEGLPKDVHLFITGRSRGRERQYGERLPDNVTLMGFLSEADFEAMLSACDCIMDLTTREDCLVCGAYEAVAVKKPMILSDTAALRGYFSEGVVYTQNDAASIADSIRLAVRNKDVLESEVASLHDTLQRTWEERRVSFESELGMIGGVTGREG